MRSLLLVGLLTIFAYISLSNAASGKITGTVKDANTNEPLIGANIIIEGTTIGAASNVDGYYVILNVPPGTYTLKVSMIGYATSTIQNVQVNIDQTTNLDIQLHGKSIQTQEVVVVAKTPVVQKDVAASTVNISAKQVENLPVASISSVVGLQAGVETNATGLVIRGGAVNETGLMLNGVMMRDERTNNPFMGISYTAIQEVQVQTGGFSAKYGDIRSGLVNVVTKEGSKNKYTFSLLSQYRAPNPKHFGISPNSANSYWIRPYIDGDVAFFGSSSTNPATGLSYWSNTYAKQNPEIYSLYQNGTLSKTQYQEILQDFAKQYPDWEGWVAYTNKLLNDSDPTNDLSPEAARKLFLYQHRRDLNIVNPDYVIDASFGGPVPIVSQSLGNLRFFASYRQTQNEYVIPLSEPGVNDFTGQLKVTSNVGKGKKLMVQGMIAQSTGTNDNNAGSPGIFSGTSPSDIAGGTATSTGPLSRVSYIDSRMFAPNYWAPSTIDYNAFSGKYTNVISPSTFYEIQVSQFTSKYKTGPAAYRDTAKIYKFGNSYYTDQAPTGFWEYPSTAVGGMRMSVGFSNSRDSSTISYYQVKAELQSQIDKYNQVEAGGEFTYTDNNVHYASVDTYLPSGRSRSTWHTFPVRAALYAQDKLEFEGMVATLGLRLDYSNPGGDWYDFSHYTSAFEASSTPIDFDTVLTVIKTIKQLDLSPRLAIAFPITENSKLYFNYGHFRQMPTPDNLYLIRRYTDNNQVTRVADPNAPLPKTISYELGYEQNLFDEYLVRLSGYYNDKSLQSRTINYISRNSKVDYNIVQPDNYGDIRGFELSLSKSRGNWFQGFINYTYEVSTYGNFGYATYYQNPADQTRYEATTTSYYQTKPVPQPYARANIDFFTPVDFGPALGKTHLLGDWRLSFIASWRSGYHFTWAGGSNIPGVVNNLQWKDYQNVDLRVTKSFNLMGVDVQLFAEIHNLFNYKYMSGGGFVDANDYLNYMKSLHLPAGAVTPAFGYVNVPGSDTPGDYRTGPYVPWDVIEAAPAAQKDQWTKDKAYIDMPNQSYFTFLNPRDIYWGLKLSFAITD